MLDVLFAVQVEGITEGEGEGCAMKWGGAQSPVQLLAMKWGSARVQGGIISVKQSKRG